MKDMSIKSKAFKQQVAKHLNVSHLTASQQDRIVSVLMDSVSDNITMAIWDRFLEQEKKEMKGILTKSGQKQPLDYIGSKINNFPKLVEDITRQTMDDFRKRRAAL